MGQYLGSNKCTIYDLVHGSVRDTIWMIWMGFVSISLNRIRMAGWQKACSRMRGIGRIGILILIAGCFALAPI